MEANAQIFLGSTKQLVGSALSMARVQSLGLCEKEGLLPFRITGIPVSGRRHGLTSAQHRPGSYIFILQLYTQHSQIRDNQETHTWPGNATHWQTTCLACTRLWLRSPAPHTHSSRHTPRFWCRHRHTGSHILTQTYSSST